MRGRSLAYLRASLNRKRAEPDALARLADLTVTVGSAPSIGHQARGVSAISSISSRVAPADALTASAASAASRDASFDPIAAPSAIHAATTAARHAPSVVALARPFLHPTLSPPTPAREVQTFSASQLAARYCHNQAGDQHHLASALVPASLTRGIRRDSVSSYTPHNMLRLRSPFHSLASGRISASASSTSDSGSSSDGGSSSGSTAGSSSGSSSSAAVADSEGVEREEPAHVAPEGSLGGESPATAESSEDAQVAGEGGEGGLGGAEGITGGEGRGGNAALQTPLEQLWEHVRQLPDSNHVMPVVKAWESNGNTVDKRLTTQLIKKLKNQRRPRQAAEVAEWFVQQPGFPRLEADYQLVLSAVIRARNVAAAQAMFLSLPEEFRTEKVYQPVFGHVARRGRFMSVASQVEWLRQQGVVEGIPSFNARLQALLAGRRRGAVVAGIGAIMEEMRSKGFAPTTITFNIILAGFGRAGQLKEMEEYLGQMENFNLTPDLATINALISAYVSHGEPEKALEWERRLKTSGAGPDRGTYAAMLRAYGQSGQVDKLEATWNELIGSTVPLTRVLHKARIEGYGMAGDVAMAEKAFQDLRVQQAPVTETFNSLVFAYAHNGLIDKAKATRAEMEATGMRPDGITFLHLLRAHLAAHQIDDAVTTLRDAAAAGVHKARMKLPFRAFAEVLQGFVEGGDVGKVRELVGLARTMYRTDANLFNSIIATIANAWRKKGPGTGAGAGGVEGGSGGESEEGIEGVEGQALSEVYGEEFVSEVRAVLVEMREVGVKANDATEEVLRPLGLSHLVEEVGLMRAVRDSPAEARF
ncbi:hypothetical protein CLOM_g1084 [Closterium sp. NIES-68]|nr:hypothetical protein CLOM_g1084 [Closterium sp. NIES-68]GJP69955.1 hypothetical protein CLOP_g949 [Closterium sp. NIES-67]